MTPFIFYLVGGYLAITGRLDIGQLVAVIAAYKELPSPLKDLIDWDQQRLDVQVKYTQVVEQFTIGKVLDPALQKLDADDAAADRARDRRKRRRHPRRIRRDAAGAVDRASSLRGEAVAAVGPVGAGGEYLAEAFARLVEPSSGRILLDGTPIETLPDSVTGRRIGYAEANTYFPQSSLRDSLIYGLRHAPLRPAEKDAREEQAAGCIEALASGNPDTDVADDWIDYEAAGATGPEDLLERLREVLVIVDLENDVYRLGLRSRMPEAQLAELDKPHPRRARRFPRAARQERRAEHYVEMFDPDRYVVNASVKENLVFGVADTEALGGAARGPSLHGVDHRRDGPGGRSSSPWA